MFDSGNREDAVDDHVVERVDFASYTETCEDGAAPRVVEGLEDSPFSSSPDAEARRSLCEFRQAAPPETRERSGAEGAMPERREAKSEGPENSGLQHAARRRHGARCSD